MKKFVSCLLVASMVFSPGASVLTFAEEVSSDVTVSESVDTTVNTDTETNETVTETETITETDTNDGESSDKKDESTKTEKDSVLSDDAGETEETVDSGIEVKKSEDKKVASVPATNTVNATDINGVKVSVVRKSDSRQMYRNADLAQVVSGLEPGTYDLTIESVPSGYFILKKLNEIEVVNQGSEDPFKIAIGTTETWVKVKDKTTGSELTGVKGDLINDNGYAVYNNVDFPIHTSSSQPLAPGSYVIHLTSVPDGYVIPDDKNISVEATTDPQTFWTEVGHTKINIHAVNDATDQDLTDVKVDLLDNRGNPVVSNVKLPFNVTTSDDADYIKAGTYKIHVRSVPAGYVPCDDVSISVKSIEKEQNFEIRLKKTSITVRAQDKDSKKELENVAVTIFDSEGAVIRKDTDLRYVGNYVAAGTYKLHVTHVPDGYALPKSDTIINVKVTDQKQTFIIDLDYTKIKVMAVDKETGNPVSVVRATLVNNNGHEIYKNQVVTKMSDHIIPGGYKIKIDSVPAGYIIPGAKEINIAQTSDLQTFKVELDFTKAKFKAVTKSGSDLSNVIATIYDPAGRTLVSNRELAYATTRIAPGQYRMHVNRAPAGYATPADKTVTLQNKADQQVFSIALDEIKTKVHYREKYTNNYIKQRVSMHFEDSNGAAVAIYDTTTGYKAINKVPAGTYKVVFDVVPGIYKTPATQYVTVRDSADLQEYTFTLELRYQILLATAKAGNKSITYSWNKIHGAEGYDIYIVRCGNDYSSKPSVTIKGNQNFTFRKEGLKNHKEYKAKVVAWHYVDGEKKAIATSPQVHSIVKNTMGDYVNAKSVTLKSKSKLTLKKNKTSKIKADVVKLKKSMTLFYKNHTAKLRYYSSNPAIASVSSKGKIKAKAKGKCKIYVLATNGVKKSIAVTVK
jgi:hypothetical protein